MLVTLLPEISIGPSKTTGEFFVLFAILPKTFAFPFKGLPEVTASAYVREMEAPFSV